MPKKPQFQNHRLNENSELLNDLGIYGDDADDLLINFCKEFHVSHNSIRLRFPEEQYFPPEGFSTGVKVGVVFWVIVYGFLFFFFDSVLWSIFLSILVAIGFAIIVNAFFRKKFTPIRVIDLVKLVAENNPEKQP